MHPLAPKHDAPQHRPRPLPLFMAMVADYAKRDPLQAEAALRGLKRYQQAPRDDAARPNVASEPIGRATLYSYGGDGPPVLLVPSIINPPFVLDMADDNSLALALADAGFAVHLLDWGRPGNAHVGETLGDHVTNYLLPAIERIGADVHLLGHCLGGTLAIGAASVGKLAGVATLASPWDFSRYPDAMRASIGDLWQQHRDAAVADGIVPLELLQIAFWSIEPDRNVAKFAKLDSDPSTGELARFVALEDWANSGAPLPVAAGRELFEDFIGANATAKGQWTIAGESVDADVSMTPMLHIASSTDRIVPAAAVPDFGQIMTSGAGHIGMVVGKHMKDRLVRPLVEWLRRDA